MMQKLFVWIGVLTLAVPVWAQSTGEDWDWPAAMKRVAANSKAKVGKVVLMGDSITYANQAGRWARYGQDRTPEEIAICRWMRSHENDAANGWWLAADDQPKGRSWTAASGCTSGEYITGGKGGLPALAQILKEHQPQIALIMLGTNDINQKVPVDQYLKNMETIYVTCLKAGAMPVVQTVPPTTWDKAGLLPKYNTGLKMLAKKHRLPLIDVYGEFLARRPGDAWQGTLVSNDGAHFTHDHAQGPATEENLKNDGNLLRGWLMVYKIAEIKKRVLD